MSPEHATAVFSNQSVGANSYEWDFGYSTEKDFSVHPTHIFPIEQGGSYKVELVAFSARGCSDTTSKIVEVKEELYVYVPNSFTPDGDEFNNEFLPVVSSGFDCKIIRLQFMIDGYVRYL